MAKPRYQLILCVNADAVNGFTTPEHGLLPHGGVGLHSIIHPRDLCMMPRDLVEADESFRQFISYGVLRCGAYYASYERAGSEERIHKLVSIGFGGHIGFSDFDTLPDSDGILDLDATIAHSLKRELREEVGLYNTHMFPHRPLGKIISFADPVNKVHIGVAVEIQLDSRERLQLQFGDGEIKEVIWRTREELLALPKGTLEAWSSEVLPTLVSGNSVSSETT